VSGAGGRPARALWFEAARTAVVRDEVARDPGPGEVQVEAVCSLVSAGSELAAYRGELPADADVGIESVEGSFRFPVKFGYQVIGRVVETGPCTRLGVGDRVFAQHPHQDRFTLRDDERTLFRLPDELDPARAAFIGLYRVALNCLHDVPVRPGDCVAVSGLGVVGTFCAHLAAKVAGSLVLVDPAPGRRALASWIGADALVEPQEAREAVRALSDGRGTDVFIEASGAPGALQVAIDCSATEGTIGVVSWYGTRPVVLDLGSRFHTARLRLVSSWVGLVATEASRRWTVARQRAAACRELARLDVDRLVTHTVAFEDAPSAYALCDRSPDEALGVLLEYGGRAPRARGRG